MAESQAAVMAAAVAGGQVAGWTAVEGGLLELQLV